MAKIPSIKSLLPEKFQGQQPWIMNLIVPLNAFMTQVVDAFNKKVNVSDNLEGDIVTFTTAGIYPINIKWTYGKPRIGMLCNIQREDGATVSLASAITPIWRYNQEGQIEISAVAGLSASASDKYKISMVFLIK